MIAQGRSKRHVGLVIVAVWAVTAVATGCAQEVAKDAVKELGRWPQVVEIAVLTSLAGTLEPCGCTADQLGGLDRVAAAIEDANPPVALLVVGDTFVPKAPLPADLHQQRDGRAKTIGAVLSRLATIGLAPGQNDLDRAPLTDPTLAALPLLHRQPTANKRLDTVLRHVGPLRLGIVSVNATAANTASAAALFTEGARALRAQGADAVIAAIPADAGVGSELASAIDAVDVAVIGGATEPGEPRVLGGTLMVDAGERGQHVGHLRFHLRSPVSGNAFRYFDGGRAARHSLTARVNRLEQAVASMAAGPGRKARQHKLDELRKELAARGPLSPPPGNYLTFETTPITADRRGAAWAKKHLIEYDKSLCELTRAATADRQCRPAATPAARFVGNVACISCHEAAMPVYKNSGHSHAWSTLEKAGKDCDTTCVGCHSVGFMRPGGFCRLQDVEVFKDVGCESCHGPGAGHVAAKKTAADTGANTSGAHFIASPDASNCQTCHNREHSPHFDFDTFLPRVLGVGHGLAQGSNGAAAKVANTPAKEPK